jgi:DNA-binding beta-propeller fold protein YncE
MNHLLVLLVATLSPNQGHHGNSLMALSPDGRMLAVACTDAGTVCGIRLPAMERVWETPVGKRPESVTFVGTQSLVAVTLYDEDALVLLNANSGTQTGRLALPDEPYGVVCNSGGTRLYVSHDYPGLVTEIDPSGPRLLRTMTGGARNRGIALAPDEKNLYVSEFHTGRLVALNLGSGLVSDTWTGHSTDNLARHVLLHPRRPKAYLSHVRSRIKIIDGGGSIFPQLTIHDLVPPGSNKRSRSFGMDTYNGVYVVTNPWEADISPDGKRLFTLYAGTDDMNVSDVIDDDYKEIQLVGGAVRVGHNPRAVRVAPDGKSVFVFDSLDFQIRRLDATTLRVSGTVKVSKPAKSDAWIRGKVLFSTARTPMSGRLWVACASCHPDGQPDGRIWHNPEGMRKTPSLSGLAHTHPLHFSADRDESQDFEFTIRSRLMQGSGLIPGRLPSKVPFKPTELEVTTSGKSPDLDALALYTNSFNFTLSPHIEGPGKLSTEAERGRILFNDNKVGCATCHSGPYYSDSSLQKPFKLHDVGTGKDDPSEKIGPTYDTPTLLGVYKTAPYLHHGKAATLLDVLTTANKDNRHGNTSQLAPGELNDLVAFMKSLPFEQPPLKTPNTVSFVEPVR